jgi:hypothetical protein
MAARLCARLTNRRPQTGERSRRKGAKNGDRRPKPQIEDRGSENDENGRGRRPRTDFPYPNRKHTPQHLTANRRPETGDRRPRTQAEDLSQGSITKIFAGPAARGHISMVQNEDPVRRSITKIFTGPAARGTKTEERRPRTADRGPHSED